MHYIISTAEVASQVARDDALKIRRESERNHARDATVFLAPHKVPLQNNQKRWAEAPHPYRKRRKWQLSDETMAAIEGLSESAKREIVTIADDELAPAAVEISTPRATAPAVDETAAARRDGGGCSRGGEREAAAAGRTELNAHEISIAAKQRLASTRRMRPSSGGGCGCGGDGEGAARKMALVAQAAEKGVPRRSRCTDCRRTTRRGASYDGTARERVSTREHGVSPVMLIDMRFIIALGELGGTMVRRQDLPKGGVYRPRHAQEVKVTVALPIISIRTSWQQPDHPDPKEVNLQLLAKGHEDHARGIQAGRARHCCCLRVSAAKADDRTHAPLSPQQHASLTVPFPSSCAHAHSFMSLFQKGPNGEERTAVELTVFKKSLSNMMEWYAHPYVYTFKLTRLPKGYPTGFKFPPGMEPNLADYEDSANDRLLTHPPPYSHTRCGLVLCRVGALRVVGQQPDQGLLLGARPRQV